MPRNETIKPWIGCLLLFAAFGCGEADPNWIDRSREASGPDGGEARLDTEDYPPISEIEIDMGFYAPPPTAVQNATLREYRVYEFPVPGDYRRGRRGTWTGALVFNDLTGGADFETVEAELDPFVTPGVNTTVELGYYLKGDSASHLLATESGQVAGVITSTPRQVSISIDVDGDMIVDFLNTLDLATGLEVVTVAVDELWALEELLAGRNLLCHPGFSSHPGLEFANGLDPLGVSPAHCKTQSVDGIGGMSIGGNDLVEGGTLDDQCENHTTTSGPDFSVIAGDTPTGVWVGLGMVAGGIAVVVGAAVVEAATGGAATPAVIPVVAAGADLIVAGAAVMGTSARADASRPEASSGGDAIPIGPDDDGEGTVEAWVAEMCEARNRNRAAGIGVASIEDLEAVVSPVDNRCDDPAVNPNPAAEDDSTAAGPIRLCSSGEEEGEGALLGSLSDVIGDALDPDCDPSNTEEFCEPALYEPGSGRGTSVAWGMHHIIGTELCPEEVCNPGPAE